MESKRRYSGPELLRVFVVAAWCVATTAPAAGAEATTSLLVRALISSRTSFRVSTENLRFDVLSPGGSTTASVDFSASVRTRADGNVMLAIEVLGINGDRLDEAGSVLTFAGEGEGTAAGTIETSGSSQVAHWTGSGCRNGRLVFTLRTRAAGSYIIPVRFVLTAP